MKKSWINEVIPEVMNIFIDFNNQKYLFTEEKYFNKKNHTIQKAK